jgi:hypothetical protein
MEFTMNTEIKIPDAETRAKIVARWKEVCVQFDYLNALLDEAIAIAEADLQNSPLYVRRRERLKKQIEQQAIIK